MTEVGDRSHFKVVKPTAGERVIKLLTRPLVPLVRYYRSVVDMEVSPLDTSTPLPGSGKLSSGVSNIRPERDRSTPIQKPVNSTELKPYDWEDYPEMEG